MTEICQIFLLLLSPQLCYRSLLLPSFPSPLLGNSWISKTFPTSFYRVIQLSLPLCNDFLSPRPEASFPQLKRPKYFFQLISLFFSFFICKMEKTIFLQVIVKLQGDEACFAPQTVPGTQSQQVLNLMLAIICYWYLQYQIIFQDYFEDQRQSV